MTDELSDDRKNCLIAAACGWTWEPWGKNKIKITAPAGYRSSEWMTNDTDNSITAPMHGTFEESELYYRGYPDYTNSMDAMHEATQALNESQKALFECTLVEITSEGEFEMGKHPVATMHYVDALSAIHASAKQRAEALGRTLGLWT